MGFWTKCYLWKGLWVTSQDIFLVAWCLLDAFNWAKLCKTHRTMQEIAFSSWKKKKKRHLCDISVSFKRQQSTFKFTASLSATPWTLRTFSFPVPQQRHPTSQIPHKGGGASLLQELSLLLWDSHPKTLWKSPPHTCCATALLPQGFLLHLPLVLLGQGCQTPQDKRSPAGPRYTLNRNSYIVALHAVCFTRASVFFVRHIKHRVGFNGWWDPVKANCMFKYKGWKDLYYSTNF